MALLFDGAQGAPYMAGIARPTLSKGDPAGRPFYGGWGMGCAEGGRGRRPLAPFPTKPPLCFS
jgi:hypothetical protein